MKISVITPVYNQKDFIEQTILSVINQKYDNLEYIIVDGGSTDGTIEIIKKYQSEITHWISEPDNGMYDALNKGFKLSTGEIMAWINSDDMLLPGALENMCKLFSDLPNVNWIQGINSFIDVNGKITSQELPKKFSLMKFLNYDYMFIQQESTFWRRSLWEIAGNYIDSGLKMAGDFELWFRFFQFENLYTAPSAIGAWREREGQLSAMHMDLYIVEVNHIISDYKISVIEEIKVFVLRGLHKVLNFLKRNNFSFFLLKKKIDALENTSKFRIDFSNNDNKYYIF